LECCLGAYLAEEAEEITVVTAAASEADLAEAEAADSPVSVEASAAEAALQEVFNGSMEEKLEKIKQITGEFIGDIKTVFGENLISAVLYGAVLRDEKRSYPYIKFLVVLKDSSPSELSACSFLVKKWHKNLIAIPLFVQPEFITDSLDTFPLEFMDMRSKYEVLYGIDPLKDLAFSKTDVRKQCERELKGKLLHLRAEYIELRNDIKLLAGLITRTIDTFRSVFSGALFLKDAPVPSETKEIITSMINCYELDGEVFRKLEEFASGATKKVLSEADNIFDKYVEELENLSSQIDKLEITEEK
jgi:hypothetical protein